ncbi:MAG: hypothetical protein JW719_10005 [Pirellulales bacterium]|nr:hypothetical protein [Pirellulales bacterium]
MKTTARILWGLVAVAFGLSACWTSASPVGFVLDAQAAALMVSQAQPSSSSTPAAGADARSQSDDLLARARQAIDEGHFDVAAQLLDRAEALKVPYNPLNPLVDTPAKVRRDLERRRAAGSSPNGLGGLLPTLPLGNRPQGTPVPPDAFAQNPPMQAQPAMAGPAGQATIPYYQPNSGQPTTLPAVDDDAAGYATIESTPPVGASFSAPQQGPSNSLLLEARRALAMGDVRRATDLVDRAKAQPIAYGPQDDTPDRVLSDVNKLRDLAAHRETHGQTEAYRRELARLMLEQAEALLKWNDCGEAERLAIQARDQQVTYGPLETNPDALLERIANARRGQRANGDYSSAGGEGVTTLPAPSVAAKKKATLLVDRARAALADGDVASARAYAQAAMDLQVPESNFAPGEDRPGMVLLDIQKAIRADGSRVMQASAASVMPATGAYPPNQQASNAVYRPANDPTGIVPAAVHQPASSEPPRPLMLGQAPVAAGQAWPNSPAAGNTAATLFQQGEEALKAHNVPEALNYYRQAAQYSNQLDPTTAQALQDRLQMLSRSTAPEAPQGTLADEAMAKQQLLARKVNSDIAHQEQRAAQLRQTDPKTALALLEQARARVAGSGLEPNTRGIILRRVDRNIAELKKYMEENRATINLADQNNQVRDQIDRERQYELEVQQRLAALGDKFKQLCDEQRFAEAEVVAKEAYDLAPENPFARQLLWNAKFVRRVARNQALSDEKEGGFIDSLLAVDVASVPINPDTPYLFPSATEWSALTASRGRFRADTRKERTGHELQIQRKLSMPVSVKFSGMPLNQVVAHLQQLADVNMYLDPQGLREEGIDPSTLVDINLPHEITLESALKHILEPLHLSYVIKNEVLKITSEQYSKGEVYMVTYDVGDLVIPIPNFMPNSRMGLGGAYNDAMARNGFNSTYGSGPMGDFSSTGTPQTSMIQNSVLAQVGRPAPGSMAGGAPPSPTGLGPGGLGGGSQADFEPLIELITSTVAPDSWTEMGGNGTIEPYENNLTLVIKTTEEIHAEIVDVLAQLRRLQDLQVTIEVRFITLNDDFFESIRVDFDFDIDDNIDRPYQVFGRIIEGGDDDDDDDDDDDTSTEPDRDVRDTDHDRSLTVGMSAPGVFSADLDIPFTQGSYGLAVPQFGGFDASAGASLGFAVLSDIEAFFFINAAQGDSRTNILQAPKVTLFNGQTAYVQDVSMSPFVMGLIPVVGDFAAAQQPVIVILSEGTFMTVQAVVSHDRRFVRLTVVPFFSQIGDVNTFTFSGRTTSLIDTSTEGNTSTPDDATKENNVRQTTSEGTTVQLPTFSTISVSTTVSVPDGGTVLLGGIKRLSEGRAEYGTPILNKIPYLNRLFRNVGIGRETQSLMMTVTPRIIIQEEEEERIQAGPRGP